MTLFEELFWIIGSIAGVSLILAALWASLKDY